MTLMRRGAHGLNGPGIIPTIMKVSGAMGRIPSLEFDPALVTFTPSMAKRTGEAGVFDGAPIIQGRFDGSGVPDVLSFSRGDQLANPTDYWYEQFDPNQGTAVKWWTPEKDRDGTQTNDEYLWYINSTYFCRYEHDNQQLFVSCGNQTHTDALTTVAGTSYCVAVSWDVSNTIDGTNYIRISVNDTHDYGATTQPTAAAPDATIYLGSNGTGLPANAILEGVTIYRRVLFDGTYGASIWFDGTGPIDELAAIYSAGAGVDPGTITGSWDATFCLPTDSSTGALTTGTGEAWSHPHDSSLLDQDLAFLWDRGYLGGPYMVYFDGADDEVNFGSDASIDDVPSGASITVEGVWRIDSDSSNRILIAKSSTYLTSGWGFRKNSSGNLEAWADCATTDAVSEITPASVGLDSFADGKCHHLTFVYDDTGDKTLYIGVGGRWPSAYATQTAGVGAYGGDAALSLYTGELNGASSDFEGAHGWLHFSNVRRYTPGTDFVPPLTLSTDGNTIEAWDVAQGSGNLTASVTSPANDGVRTGAVWFSAWDQQLTPIVPYSLEFFRENDGIDFGSGANIDDLPSGDCTIEFWFRATGATVYPITKWDSNGWFIRLQSDGDVYARFDFATDAVVSYAFAFLDDRWHHYALDWEFATRTLRLFIDGILRDSGTGAGAYAGDAAVDCIVNGLIAVGTSDQNGIIGPIRLSNSRRYTGNSFIPPSRVNWPANDANAQLITTMRDGAGSTVTDYSGNGFNGTVTFGDTTRWNISPDLPVDEPGAVMYGNQGCNIGSDGALDGIANLSNMVDADDYVIAVAVRYPNSCRGQPRIRIWDVVGAASLVDFDGPRLNGQHSGANNSATMTDGGEVFPASLIGSTIYNITDGSSATITAVGGTNQDTITAALAGGTDNDWDTNDVYMIKPPDGWAWFEPIALRTGANADIEVQLLNIDGEGVLTWHKAEVLDSLLANGDMEAGAGNPYIVSGWTNSGLLAGESAADAVDVHSGSQSIAYNVAGSRYQYDNIVAAQGAFIAVGVWGREDAGNLVIGDASGRLQFQSTAATFAKALAGAAWGYYPEVCRVNTANPSRLAMRSLAAGSQGNFDDYGIIALNAVSITCTPASEANSAENGGLRIDGYDRCTQPQPAAPLRANRGRVLFNDILRHANGDFLAFGQPSSYIFELEEDANNYIYLLKDAANRIQLIYNANGAGAVTGTWQPTTIVADTLYTGEVVYTPGYVRFLVDGVAVIDIAGVGAGFATDFTAAIDWGSDGGAGDVLDGVLIAP